MILEIFLFLKPSARTALGPSQCISKWVPRNGGIPRRHTGSSKNANKILSILYVFFISFLNLFRRCATIRTVPGSIPCGVTGFFSDIFPSDRTIALGSTQHLLRMSTRNIPGVKGGRCVRLTTSPPSRAECHEFWEPKHPGTFWATPGLIRDCFTFTLSLRYY